MQIDREASSYTQNVYLFQGGDQYNGICYESFAGLEKQISKVFAEAFIVKWNNEFFPPAQWKQYGLCVLPGGECGKWNKILSPELQQQILKWIENGGRILGICAGGYFCAVRSRYLINADCWIEAMRTINVFKGTCQGPLFSNNIEIVKIRWEETQEEGYATVIKGGEFIQDPDCRESGCEVLARFVDKSDAIAAVRCNTGDGMAVLSSVHWEFGCKDIRPVISDYPYLAEKLALLKIYKDFRIRCFTKIMTLLA